MNRLRSTVLRTLAVALSAAAVLSGCAPGAAEQQDRATEPLVIGLTAAPTTLFPGQPIMQRAGASIVKSIYSSLTKVQPDLTLAPDLAAEWQQLEPNRWRFTLREGVEFSDGTPLTAETVKWNFDNYLDPDSEFVASTRSYLTAVEAVEVAAPNAVDFVTGVPESNLPYLVSFFGILDPDWAQSHNVNTEALGTGPYTLVSFDPQAETVLARNPDYFGEAPEFEQVTFRYYVDDAQRRTAVESGEADLVIYVNPSHLASLEGTAGYTVGAVESNRAVHVRLTFTDPVIQDIRVRQALNYAVDRQAIVDNILQGYTSPSNGSFFADGAYGLELPEGLNRYEHDPERSKQLLAEAGYPDGLELNLDYTPGRYIAVELVAQALKDQLDQAGFRITLSSITLTQEQEKISDGTIGPLELFGIAPNDSSWRSQLYHFDSSYGTNTWHNADYDATIQQIRGETDTDASETLFQQAVEIFNEDAAVVFLYNQPLTYAIKDDLEFTFRRDEWLLPAEISVAR